jgi:4-hydroxybenzoate polyprenyltransferase
VPGLIWLGERASLASLADRAPASASLIHYSLVLFMSFGFTVTLLREIVKDLEDMAGDRVAARRTLPIVWGERPTRHFALLLGFALALALPLSLWRNFSTPPTLLTIVVISLAAALLFLLFRLARARDRMTYGRLSRYLKWFMLGGLLFLLLFRWYR